MPNRSSGSVRVFFPPRSREELIAELRRQMPALRAALPVQRAVLFGSWAAGRATAFSDIDVLIVYAGSPRSDAYATVRRCIGLRGLEAHVYCQADAAALSHTIDRMTRESVDLL
jgi:predicted nucleotidyltransferase